MTKHKPTLHGSGESLHNDLVTLIMQPLADLVDRARVEILEKIQRVDDSLDIIARQMRRELDGDRG